jgi:hypothetical protein
MTRLGLYVLVVTCVGAVALDAQASTTFPEGPLLFHLRTGERLVGNVALFEADTLWLRPGTSRLTLRALPANSVEGFSVAVGRNYARGARRGALVGVAAGAALIGLALHFDLSGKNDGFVPATLYALPTALLTTSAGAAIGFLLAPTRWSDPVPLRQPAPR